MTPQHTTFRFRNRLRSAQRSTRRLTAILADLRDSLSTGQVAAVEQTLHPGVTLLVDSGGHAPGPTAPIRDRATAARTLVALLGPTTDSTSTVVSANGMPALAFACTGGVIAVLTVRAKRGRATDVWVVTNPDKLRRWNRE
jgi:RNA polymerase sigma-70 factor (ECF subfamily)